MSAFQKATRKKAKARVGIVGPAGSGKTYSALMMAFGMGGKIAVIDTEHGSADLYAHLGDYDVAPIIPPFTIDKYLALIKEAEKAAYDIIIIDSLSHAWAGTGGLLEEVDKRSGSVNKFAAWRDITPKHNSLIDAMLQSPAHIIATMRSKTEYVIEENSNGKKVPRKIGMAPVQREGMDFEFTVVFDVDQNKHYATASKDRTSLFDGKCDILTREHGEQLRAWLDSGIEAPTAATPATPLPASATLTADQQKYFPRILAALKILHSDDNKAKMATIERESTIPASGTYPERPGVKDYRKLDGKPLQILAHKLEALAKKVGKVEDRPLTCPECQQPLDETGTCRNMTCPEGQEPDRSFLTPCNSPLPPS